MDNPSPDLDAQLETLYKRPPNLSVSQSSDLQLPSEIILNTHAFLRRLAKFHLAMMFGLIGAMVVLAYYLSAVSSRPPITLGYLTDTENRIVELQNADVRSVTDEDVINYAVKIAKKMHKLAFIDYLDYVTTLENEFYSTDAFSNYQYALINSKTVEMLVNQNAVSWLEPVTAPMIIEHDAESLAWVVTFDVRWSIGGGNLTPSTDIYKLELLIRQVPRKRNLDGLAVEKYLMSGNDA